MRQLQKLPHLLAPILLLVILGVAAGLRFTNLNWDGGIFAHPDERSTVAFYAPTIRWPANPDDLLDPRASTLNPFWNVDTNERRSYTYGHFPLYTLVLTAHGLTQLLPLAESLNLPPDWLEFLRLAESGQGYARIGRALVALADVFSVLLLFLMGRKMYGVAGGLLAAAFAAVTVLQIQLAHFFAVDPISTTFTLLAIYGSMLLYERRSLGAAVLTGIGIGLAIASKFSALPIVFAPALALFLADQRQPQPEKSSRKSQLLGLLLVAAGVSFVVFAVTSPFVLLDFENFRRAVLEEQGNMVSGLADFPFTRQYRGTLPYIYFIEQQLRWGMGWPLGLLGLAGTLWVIVKAIRGQAHVGELLGLAWLLLYFGPTGLFLAKFMRYMSPVVPFFSLFGAGLLVALWQVGERMKDEGERMKIFRLHPSSFILRLLAIALGAIVLLTTTLWALAFVNGVYRTEHTWISFSRWVYQNVPAGACIAYEHWDDRMPVPLPEPGGRSYNQPQLPMYDDDTAQKYEFLRDTLMNCDYVALATNRLWRTIPRLPERYPMSTRYYDALFSGELGFELVHAAETPPRLGPLVFDDQPADESFTVYDHPKPMLFKKTRQLSAAEWDALLGNTWQSAIPGYVGEPPLLARLRGAQSNLTAPAPVDAALAGDKLLLDTPVDQLPVVDDFRWNTLANNSAPVAVVVWWLAVMLIGWVAWPLTFWLFHRLPDRGYTLSKSLGLLLLTYSVWLTSSVIGNGWLGNALPTILLMLLLLVALNIAVGMTQRPALAEFIRAQKWRILAAEGVFSAAFVLFLGLRILNPDLWHPWLGGEKMLEIGFLNAIVKSAAMPPYDPFFAGGIINYYYYGLFLVGVLIKLTGIAPSIAFNLAIPTLAALTAISAFGLAANIARAMLPRGGWLAGLSGGLGVLFVLLMGNLEGAAQFFRNMAALGTSEFSSAIPGLALAVQAADGFTRAVQGHLPATYNYWDPTRVIPETINEFPFFSYLFADLHPHMIGIPFTLLLLSLAFQMLVGARSQESGVRGEESGVGNQESGDSGQWSVVGGQSSVVSEQPSPEVEPTDNPQPTSDHSPFTIHHSPFTIFLRWLAIPFTLGSLAAINTWDLPTYLGLVVAAFVLARYRRLPDDFSPKQAGFTLLSGGLFAAAVLAVTYLLFLPFFANYQAPAETGVGLVHTQTPLGLHLKIWGFFIFIIVSWLWVNLLHPGSRLSLLRLTSAALRRWNVLPHFSELYRALVKRQGDGYQVGLWLGGGVLLVAALLFLLGYRVPAYLLPLVALSLALLLRREVPAADSFLNLLLFTGLLLLLGVEFFFLRDFLGGGDYYRMNTLFKFYTQVWVLFGVAVGVALPLLWERAWRWSLPAQVVWRSVAMLLLLAGLFYPVFGSRTRVDDRFPGDDNRPPVGTLDGLAYMTTGVFEWPAGNAIELKYDYEAIRWLQDNISGTPVLAEAKVGYYREGGMRVAAYTGLPSILGGLHQNEQRPGAQIGRRDGLVNELWSTVDAGRAQQLIDQLGIQLIYVGQVERALYGPNVGDKFEELRQRGALELVFENEQTRIYRVK